MTRERHLRIKDLFLQVCDLDPADRLPILAAVDEQSRREVDALLAIHDAEPTHPLAADVDADATCSVDAAPVPEIPDYRLSTAIGEGGMGRVYAAEQLRPVRRRVAIKVLKGGLGSRDVMARFESERQTLALMSHKNVARVLDAGTTEQGEPFFAMELVEGEAITAYCERHRLDVDARLRLFVEVCHGVQHAHQRGILHRDLKPSNILVSQVDDQPLPVIIDFGIAKAVGPGLGELAVETIAGHLVGTPAYMSPEQLSLGAIDLDTRTDVYSLGVILYELLTGEVPFEPDAGSSFDELRDRIRQVEPLRPSALVNATLEVGTVAARARASRRLRGDLDWITLKALAKNRDDRYASASELAADIQRHLEGQPVLAGPPSTLYRLRKFVLRHRLGVAAGTATALALMLGLAGTSVGLVRARRAESEARQQARTAQEVSRFLVDIFQVSDPARARGEIIDAREILRRGARKIGEELGEEPVIRAALMRTMGEVYRNLGLFADAEPLLEQAVELQAVELGDDHPQTASSRVALGWLYHSQGKLAEAEATLKRAVSALRESDEAEADYAWALQMLGVILRDRGELKQARADLESSLEIRERLFGPDDVRTAWSRYHLAWLENLEANYAQARALYEQVLPIFERQLGADGPAVAWCLNDLGVVLQNHEEYEEASAALERSIAINEKVLGPEHPDLAAPLQNLAIVLSRAGDDEGAIAAARRAAELRQRSLGPQHPELAGSLNSLGFFLMQAGHWAEAEAAFERSLTISEAALRVDHPDYASTLNNLAVLYRETGRGEEARPLIERAASLQEATLGPDHPELAATLSNLAALLAGQGSLEEAQTILERTLEMREKAYGPEHLTVGLNLCHLAELHRLQGDLVAADALAHRGLAIVSKDERTLAGSFRERLYCLFVGAALETFLSPTERSGSWFRRATELMDEHPELVSPVDHYREAVCRTLRGERERALAKLRQAIDAGYRSASIATEGDLASLRGDPDFEELVARGRP